MAQSSPAFHFDSIQSVVNIMSPRLAHVTRSTTITADAGNLTYLDWGLWYQGRTVTVTSAGDASGKLGFIYPTPTSDPNQPNLRILFSHPANVGQPYTFNYEFDVSSTQDQLSWTETFDVSSVTVNMLTIRVEIPSGYRATGVQPSDAKVTDEKNGTQISWTGTNLSQQASIGVTVGFNKSESSFLDSINVSTILTYAAPVAALGSLALYGTSRMRSTRNKRKNPEVVLEAKATEAAKSAKQDALPTGFATLDYLLSGGLPRRTASLLTGPACDERDAIMRRFLESGTKNGGYVVYLGKGVSKIQDLLDAYPSGLIAVNASGVASGETRGNIIATTKLENLTAVNIDLNSTLQGPHKPDSDKRLCLDVVDDLLLLHRAVLARKWLTQLLQRAKELGYTTLAILNSQMHTQADIQAMIDLFEGHVEIIEREIDGTPKRILRVRKMFKWKFLDTEAILDRNRLT
jgi:hypothetical protein